MHVHHEKRKINDETNAANIGSWHSEHAKKLTLMNCHYKGFPFLKKSLSLHILNPKGPSASRRALPFLLLTPDGLQLLPALLIVRRKAFVLIQKLFTRRDVFCWSFSSWSSSATSSCFLCNNNAISVWTFMYSCAILQCCSNTAIDSLEFGHGARGCSW